MIPAWNISGVMPPIKPGEPGHSANRSPYVVALSTVLENFSFSAERLAILEGLLAYRAALHALGIVEGFQWLDGSFMEDVETLEARPPKDIDVVTFFYVPTGETQASLHLKASTLFDPAQTKINFKVDAYPSVLGVATNPYHVKSIAYWYSMWSHRRDNTWKGFLQVSLSPQEDIDARSMLALMRSSVGVV